MRRVFRYGFFQGMNPICPVRLATYPDLRYVATLTPEELATADREDLIDAQHQWAYFTRPRMMQHCFEEGCDALRPIPLDAYPHVDQMFIMREFMRSNLARITT